MKQVASVERECWRNVIGMPNSIVHSDLSKRVFKVLQHIGADICEAKIESCYCLNKEIDDTIVKFLGGKTVNR